MMDATASRTMSIPSITSTPSTTSIPSAPSSAESFPTQSEPLPAGAPTCPLFDIRHTPSAGRAVFASRDIPKDTPIFRSDDLALSVLLREYRREVCAQCFGYEHGRDLSIRDQSVGFAFCSAHCQAIWKEETQGIGLQAWAAVEKLVKGRTKEDSEMVDIDLPRPGPEAIAQAWDSVAVQAALIRTARQDPQPTKQHKKALQKALLQPLSPDILSFCLSGILSLHTHPARHPHLLALASDPTPYHNTPDLVAFTRTYLHLLAVLPLPLLPLTTPETLFTLSSRDSHNSFGIRSLEDDGSEFFGYGCWPAASYFNHSCAPNVNKRREARQWIFSAARDIGRGEEICITYLSGEERKQSREVRRKTLKRNWGFECACERCKVG